MLYSLAKEDELDFSPGSISRLREQLAKSKLPKTDVKVIISEIQTALCNRLNAGTNRNFARVPWNILKKEDIINWPEGIPLTRLSRQGYNNLKLLHKLREGIFFSEKFLKTLSDQSFDNRWYITSDNPVREH